MLKTTFLILVSVFFLFIRITPLILGCLVLLHQFVKKAHRSIQYYGRKKEFSTLIVTFDTHLYDLKRGELVDRHIKGKAGGGGSWPLLGFAEVRTLHALY